MKRIILSLIIITSISLSATYRGYDGKLKRYFDFNDRLKWIQSVPKLPSIIIKDVKIVTLANGSLSFIGYSVTGSDETVWTIREINRNLEFNIKEIRILQNFLNETYGIYK